MALKPSDIIQKLNKEYEDMANTIERYIDQELEKRYIGGSIHISMSAFPDIPPKVQEKLEKLYLDNEWKVAEFKYSFQYNETYCYFHLSS